MSLTHSNTLVRRPHGYLIHQYGRTGRKLETEPVKDRSTEVRRKKYGFVIPIFIDGVS